LNTALIENSILLQRSVFLKDDQLDGTISCPTRNCGGNVADRGIIEIRAKSFSDDECLPTNAANFTLERPIFRSQREMNQWIEWDFKTSQTEPTHYSIRTHGSKAGSGYLQHWVFEGRNEDKK
jgi:hypothetical protein